MRSSVRIFPSVTTLLAAAALGLGGCATSAKTPSLTSASSQPNSLTEAATQPIRDLGLAREKTPEILLTAAANPYAPPPANCTALAAEIAALDEVLGKDVDSTEKSKNPNFIGGLAVDAVQSAVKLPFRSVVRRLSGAERRDRAIRQATLAGTARRSYLKGAVNGQGCNNPAPQIADATPAAAATPPTADAVVVESAPRTP